MHFLSQIQQSMDLVAVSLEALRYLRSVPSALKRDLYQGVPRQTVGMLGETRRHLSSQKANTSETEPPLR
jgi:type II secretory pathway component PulJ